MAWDNGASACCLSRTLKFYFKLSDMREGIRYRFIDINNTTFDANFLSFSNYHMRLNHYSFESPNATHTMPIFFIKNIELID